MGNAQLAPKADNNNFHITESFLQDFQKHVSLVDHAVTGLARGIDIMTLTCKRSLQQRDVEVSKQPGMLTTERLEWNVLNTINEHVAENKAIMIDAVRNCLNFIVEKFACHIDVTDNCQTDLAVNKYDTYEWDCEKDFRKLSIESLKQEIASCMKQCDMQKKEIDILKKKEELYIRKIGQLHIQCQSPDTINVGVQTEAEDVHTYLKTNKTQNTGNLRNNKNLEAIDQPYCENSTVVETAKDETKFNSINSTSARKKTSVKSKATDYQNNSSELESNVSPVLNPSKQTLIKAAKVKTINNATQTGKDERITDFSKQAEAELLMKELEEKRNENYTLNLQLQMLKNTKTIRVQLYSPHTFAATTAELQVISFVRTKLQYRNIELIITRCVPQTCQADIPLLISRDSTDSSRMTLRRTNIVQTAMKDFIGILVKKRIAAVIFYRVKESDLKSENERSTDEGLGLGGVFRVGHSTSVYRSNWNDIAVEGIVEFILTAGEITQKFDDTPL